MLHNVIKPTNTEYKTFNKSPSIPPTAQAIKNILIISA